MEGFYLPSNIDSDPGINGHALEMDFVENMNLSEPVSRLMIAALATPTAAALVLETGRRCRGFSRHKSPLP